MPLQLLLAPAPIWVVGSESSGPTCLLQFGLPVVPRKGKVVAWQITATTELCEAIQRVSVCVFTLRGTRLGGQFNLNIGFSHRARKPIGR